MSENEVHITTKGCKCKWCEARRNKKRELVLAYRLVAADRKERTGLNQDYWDLIGIADKIERELEADSEKKV